MVSHRDTSLVVVMNWSVVATSALTTVVLAPLWGFLVVVLDGGTARGVRVFLVVVWAAEASLVRDAVTTDGSGAALGDSDPTRTGGGALATDNA